MNFEYDKLCEIDSDIERSNAHLRGIRDLLVKILERLLPLPVQTVLSIPPDGNLLITVPADLRTSDMEHMRAELQQFFGDNRKIAIVRSGELTCIHFPLGVSDEGSSWAMSDAG